MVTILPSNAGCAGSTPSQGAKIPHASWPRKQKPHINRWDGGAGFGLCAADIVLPDIFVKLKFLSSHRADGCCLGGFVYLRSTQNQE